MTALQSAGQPFSARNLVNDLRLAGVSVTARGGRIRWRRVLSGITGDQAHKLRAHRDQVLAHLAQEPQDHEQRPGVDGLPSWLSWVNYWSIHALTL